MKTLIAVPAMDQVPTRFCQSLATLRKVGDCAVAFTIGSLVYTSRNDLARQAVQMGADYMLWLDSDMVFQADLLEGMMKTLQENDLDILTGLYCRRVPPYTPTIFQDLKITNDRICTWSDFNEIPGGLFEVAGCGFGCVLLGTDVIMSVQAKYGQPFDPVAGVGEDLSFCWRARQCGYTITCDPSIELGHVGNTVITREFFEAYKANK